jgi:hypothetical protein
MGSFDLVEMVKNYWNIIENWIFESYELILRQKEKGHRSAPVLVARVYGLANELVKLCVRTATSFRMFPLYHIRIDIVNRNQKPPISGSF